MIVRFYLDDDNDTELMSIPSHPIPFQVGQSVHLEVKNNIPEKWTIKNNPAKEYRIVKIEYEILQYYGSAVNQQITQYIFVTLVTEE